MFVSYRFPPQYGWALVSEPRGLTIPDDPAAALRFAMARDREADALLAEGRFEPAERLSHAAFEARARANGRPGMRVVLASWHQANTRSGTTLRYADLVLPDLGIRLHQICVKRRGATLTAYLPIIPRVMGQTEAASVTDEVDGAELRRKAAELRCRADRLWAALRDRAFVGDRGNGYCRGKV